MQTITLLIVLAPLLGALIAGLFGGTIGRGGAHTVTTVGVAIAFVLSALVFKQIAIDGAESFNHSVYIWLV
ncbi:MAG: NADH-quinone oxidoreductase subunit L, partial [Gammaproteobacteria bacterium]|nr:NADH-quinone oxidoreductase subunit L [Gammaproteobacteria bacterium]